MMSLSSEEAARRTAICEQVFPINEIGSGKTLFCIHAADGTVSVYRELARILSGDVDMYGVSAVDLKSWTPFPATLNAAAAAYADKLQKMHPSGPYFLLGYSMGGQIAFEIARELVRRGEEIGEIFILDALTPSAHASATLSKRAQPNTGTPLHLKASSLALWRLFVAVNAGKGTPLVAKNFWELPPPAKCEYLFKNCRDFKIFREDNDLCLARSAGDVMYMFDVVTQLYDAVWDWEPKSYAQPIQYVKCSPRSPSEAQRATDETVLSFWRGLTSSQLCVTWLEGWHDAAVREPGIHVVADLVRQRIEKPS